MFAKWLKVIFAIRGPNKVDFSLYELCIFGFRVGLDEG